MPRERKTLEPRRLIHLAVSLALGGAVYLVPLPGIPESAKRCLSILAVASYLWVTEAIPLYSTSFLILLLQALYNISDEQTEFQIQDRLSFMRFLGLLRI